jgi:predicted nucleic acid-binding protein
VTHEYPRNPTLDSVSISRVMSLAEFGFTPRQREFLVNVMVHSGCFLERQYCAFTGTVRGQNSREFVARLVARGFARAIEPGPVRRGRLYHVHHKPLYEAIEQPDNRNRRLHSIGRMVERVMILDAVLSDRRCWWLSPEADKRTFFDMTQETGLRPEEYPHITFASGSRRTVRCFPDKLPIGIEKEDTSRFVFLYLVNRRIPVDFRQFLIRHQPLLLNLHRWTVRLLVPRRFKRAVALYKAALREELWTPLNPSVSTALETYFRERKERGGHLGDPSDRYIAQEFGKQGPAKIAALDRAWRREGDVVLWRSSSTSLRDDRMHGWSACEVQFLNAQYLQLTGAMDREARARRGAKRKSRQVGPPVSASSLDVFSTLVAP